MDENWYAPADLIDDLPGTHNPPPRHEYDRHFVEIPDAPGRSMLNVPSLPPNVFDALCVVREYEAQGAAWPSLLSDGARAWFRYDERASASREKDGE